MIGDGSHAAHVSDMTSSPVPVSEFFSSVSHVTPRLGMIMNVIRWFEMFPVVLVQSVDSRCLCWGDLLLILEVSAGCDLCSH